MNAPSASKAENKFLILQVLKCTLEGRMEELKDWISRHYLLTGDQIEKSIAYIQRELVDVSLLSKTDRH